MSNKEDEKFLMALKHREISLMSANTNAKRERNVELSEEIRSLLIPLRKNIANLEEELKDHD